MTTTSSPSNTFLQRLIGAAALDAAIYEEVEDDRSATGQAMTIVVLSSIAAGIGARGFGSSISQRGLLRRRRPVGVGDLGLGDV